MTKDASSKDEFSISAEQEKTILIDGKTFQSLPGESVLETLERENVDMAFNCREGFCGVCRTTLIKGEVDYRVDPLAFIDDDEILTCCTTPSSSIEIKIEY